MKFEYDVIVIGGGHAGCEAAVAAARLGASTLLITADLNRVAQMSCNPAVGGIAKGQIVREIDALGGQMGIVTDRSAIQFRMLNRSKGPAVWSPRSQSDRTAFIDEWRRILDHTDNLSLFQDTVISFEFDEFEGMHRIVGVNTSLGFSFRCKNAVLTAGTFLNGLMHFGPTKIEGGRISETSSKGLSEQLCEIGFQVGRMKTGTPARIDGRSIDYSLCQVQWGDDIPNLDAKDLLPGEAVPTARRDFHKFSFLPSVHRPNYSRPCYIVHTNAESHQVLRDNLADSPLYNGDIQSIGPRYCPSIETKIVTFADKESHQLFLEPEGHTTQEYYINGFSSSLPWRVQIESLSLIPALRDVHFYRPGYAIEYDFFQPTQLLPSLQTRLVEGLYFAGQVNGTTGYEEAAAQGLMAGINAARASKGESPIILRRDQAYIGVLIDDLITKGVDEPYRMFTSRAEYRILLRQDDADYRLTPLGYEIGLATEERYSLMKEKYAMRDSLIEFLANTTLKSTQEVNEWLARRGTTPLSGGIKLIELVRRPQLSLLRLREISSRLEKEIEALPDERRDEIVEAAEILIKYEGYIKRERDLAEKQTRLENLRIPDGFDYESINSLSTEARQKLTLHRPLTLGMASRIPGVSPADINILMLLLRK